MEGIMGKHSEEHGRKFDTDRQGCFLATAN